MDVIHVTVEVSLIADEMFLRNGAAIDLVHPAWRGLRNALAFFDGTGNMSLDLQRLEKSVSPGASVQTQCK